jgi:hypothetical protein
MPTRVFLLLLFLIPHATFSANAAGAGGGAGGGCNRQCNGNVIVPYPFGFSGDCPILLAACGATASTPLLPVGSSTTAAAAAAAPYPILSFNSTSSTFVVTLSPLCNRTIPDAKASLTGARYGVSSHTGIFVRGGSGGCSSGSGGGGGGPAQANSGCAVPSELMTRLLRTAQCGGGGGGGGGNGTAASASWTCVASTPPEASSAEAARGEGQFMAWDKVEAAGCQDALTAAVYASTPQGVPSVEFGVAELGWWLPGSCADGTAAGRCAANATCRDVVTPGGAAGHRCACLDGMLGDGFAAGEGCHLGVPAAGECFPAANHCCSRVITSSSITDRSVRATEDLSRAVLV